MDFRKKLIPWSELKSWREARQNGGKRVVVTNGCFDLLHLGHASYLAGARALGDALLVGVNTDNAVRALKGPSRPIHPEEDRALLVAALESVTGVCVFPGVQALEFLRLARPDIYVKGGDYTIDTVDQDERRLVESMGGTLVLQPVVPGKSTSDSLRRIAQSSRETDPSSGGGR